MESEIILLKITIVVIKKTFLRPRLSSSTFSTFVSRLEARLLHVHTHCFLCHVISLAPARLRATQHNDRGKIKIQIMSPSITLVKRLYCHFKSLEIIDDTLNTRGR